MDFTLTDEQLRGIRGRHRALSGLVDAEKIAAVEAGTERIDRDLWKALADADLLGLAIPEADAGAGYGLMELCLLLEAQGNVVAPVPLWSTLVLGALPSPASARRPNAAVGCPASSPARSSSRRP